MAPEILRYEKYDATADLWSVGAVLYEMSVGRPPFRAQNHIELLKRIEHARDAIKFPDEDPEKMAGGGVIPVPDDLKELIRALLKRKPVERAGYDEFWKSRGLEMSKFRRPSKRSVESILPAEEVAALLVEEVQGTPSGEPWVVDSKRGIEIPEGHKIIPQEILDPKVNIPPSTFNFRNGANVGKKGLSPRMRAIQLE
jgi:serine/threonine-protein kinase ULK/ATG1